jgi:hypothetical protein
VKMRNSIFLAVLLGLLLVSTALAQEPGDTLWTRTYGGTDWDYAYSVRQTSDGGYVIAGSSRSLGAGDYDYYLVKTDANGDTLWTRTYGGSLADECTSVWQTSDGGYILTGYTSSFGAGDADVYVVKTNADGDTLWTRTYGGGAWDDASDIQQTSDGGYIIAANTYSFGGSDLDPWLVKIDASGDTLWTHLYPGYLETQTTQFAAVQQTSDGGYIAVGRTEVVRRRYDIYVVKTDAVGDTLWTRIYTLEGQYDMARSVQQTSDGGYILTGYSNTPGTDDVYLVKTNSTGDTLWTRAYGGSGQDWGHWGEQTPDGGYIVAGWTMSFGANPGYANCWLLKTDSSGDTLWTRTYGGDSSDVAYSAQQTSDGGYVLAGYTDSFGAGERDFYVVKVAGEAPEPEVSIEIVPDDPPVTVPQGGSFGYTGTVTNNTEDPQMTDVWVMAVGPSEGVYGPFKDFYDLPVDPGQSRNAHFNQHVHNRAPLGFYDYIAYCGDYPSTVMDSSFFQIEVIEGTGSSQGGWVLAGSFLQGDLADIPSEFALLGNYPNPFNAQTVIEYQLPVNATVKLEVYNLLGEKVATLVNGAEEAGYRSVTWDASEVSSGLYFYKLTAGDCSETKRMMLIK